MTFPKRWLDDHDDATSPVRDVLRSGRGMDPPEGAEDAVWLGLMGQIGAAGVAGAAAGASGKAAAAASAKAAAATGAGTGAGAAATGSVLGGGLLKAILIGTFSGIVAVSGYSVLAPSRGPSTTSQTAPASSPATAPSAATPASSGGPAAAHDEAPAALPAVAPSAAPSAPAPAGSEGRDPSQSPSPSAASESGEPSGAAPPPAADSAAGATAPLPGSAEERASRLREESEMLGQARAALRGGDTGGAMRLLEQARSKFPGGVLGQEREALTIETLAKSGARAAASARAAAFIAAHPQSPHAARLQAFVQP